MIWVEYDQKIRKKKHGYLGNIYSVLIWINGLNPDDDGTVNRRITHYSEWKKTQ